MQNGWLHKGALICPPCKDICQVRKENIYRRSKLKVQRYESRWKVMCVLNCYNFIKKKVV